MPAFRSLSIFLFVALGTRAHAQAAPAAPPSSPPAHSHAPAAPAHAHGTVVLDQFVISASPVPRNQVDLAQSTTVLGGQALLLKQQATLGDTLAAETGIHATSFGPGASRPIIRGLGGDRIRLLENSVGTLDASVTSPDHAVSIEPFLVERIEVVRGPASLLYGSNAVGGVVNVITHRIETDLPTEAARGALELRGSSAADEFVRGGVVDFGFKTAADRAIVLHVDAVRRNTGEVRIPGFAESAWLREEAADEAREHGEPAPAFAHGRLPNSALGAESGAVGLSFVSPVLHLGASHTLFDSGYGVPGHAHGTGGGITIDLEQRRTDVQGEWHNDTGPLRGARFKFGHSRYEHREIEPDGNIGTIFRHKGHDARLELLHGGGLPLAGAVGAQFIRSDFAAEGDEAFLPPSLTRSAAVFAFEELTRGAVAWQFGARLERTEITPRGGRTRRVDEASASLGAVWKLDPAHVLAVAVTHTGRPPNAQELFAHGPHAGTRAFEIGAASLDSEKSLSAEASLRRRTGAVTGAITVFANRFRGYIFEQPTGQVAIDDDGAWELVAADDESAGHEALPVYRYVQRNAQFWGAEIETIWHLYNRDERHLDFRLAADRVRAHEGGRHLPRIPASRLTAGLSWATDDWTAGLDGQLVLHQRRTAAGETPGDGYSLVSAHVSRAFTSGHLRTEIFLRGSNLANAEARPHTSFVKELAPLPARSVTAGVRLSF